MSLWKKLKAAFGSGAGESADVRMDASTSSLQTVDYPHHEIHGGDHYIYCESDGDLDNLGVMDILLTTPNTTKWAHMAFSAYGALHTKFYIYETTTHTAGASKTAYNNNRNSSNTPGVTLNVSNDDGADGTLIFSREWGIDTGEGAAAITSGGSARSDAEIILKQNTKYLIRIESLTDNNVVDLCLAWYEHTDHN